MNNGSSFAGRLCRTAGHEKIEDWLIDGKPEQKQDNQYTQ